jgi:hypothetical protein
MKKNLTNYQLILTLFLLTIISCAIKTVPISSNHKQETFEIQTNKNKEKCIETILDFLTNNQISTRTIDKINGLVVTDEMKLSWSYESQSGKLEKANAYTIVEKKVRPSNNMPIKPSIVTGIWNFRLKETEKGETKITIFLSNTKAKQTDNKTSLSNELILKIISSGQFEKEFTEHINN